MYRISTFWSSDNMIAHRVLQQAVNTEIQLKWKSKRYRSLAYYFFEKEIQGDIKKELVPQIMTTHHLLIDPEYQACMARSALGMFPAGGVIWDDMTFVINNYLFGKGDFCGDDIQNDAILADMMIAYLQESASGSDTTSRQGGSFFYSAKHWMSDVLWQCRRMRTDIALVRSLCDGLHTYGSIYKACSEYIGQYVSLPLLFSHLGLGWSTESIVSLLDADTHDKLRVLLMPSYEIICHQLSSDQIKVYGQLSISHTPYVSWISRFGYIWSQTPWYAKICCSLLIVMGSSRLGGISLVILPIIWGLFALARSASQYLILLEGFLCSRYTQYHEYSRRYMSLYDTMIDPDLSTRKSITAQKTMTQWYDIVPFSGHELVWDATKYAKILYDIVIGSLSSGQEEHIGDIATMQAVHQRGKDHHLPLVIVQDGQYNEQASHRFEALLFMVGELFPGVLSQGQYTETYEIISDLISTKKYNFWFWTYHSALGDAVMVACSSGVLGWMGSYLRNRGISGSSALAAGPGMVFDTLNQSDPQALFDTELMSAMRSVMKPEDVTRFVDVVVRGQQSSTLRTMMASLFGEHQGNIYTNHLMDHRWRVKNISGESNLFTASLDNGLPTRVVDAGWTKMLHFLHRIYGYENLKDYQYLINQSRLSDTLVGLKNGTLSLEQFSQLDIRHREIVTQAMFYSLPKEDLTGLFVHVSSGQVVDTATSLNLGQKIVDFLGRHKTVTTVVGTGSDGVRDIGTGLVSSGGVGSNISGLRGRIEGWFSLFEFPLFPVLSFPSFSWPSFSLPSFSIPSFDLSWFNFSGSDLWVISRSSWLSFDGRFDRLSFDWFPSIHMDIGAIAWRWICDGMIAVWDGIVSRCIWLVDIVVSRWDSVIGRVGGFISSGTDIVSHGTDSIITGDIKIGGDLITGGVTTSTRQIDQILSGISPDDITQQMTGGVVQSADSSSTLDIYAFTLPILKRNKKIN